MKKITILILLLAQIQAQGQTTLERRSTNAQSGTSKVNNLNISWTLGEPIVGTTQAGSYKLTQGFQQPEVRVTIPPSVCTQYTADNTNQRCNPQTFKPFALQLGSELMKLEAVTFQKKADGTATLKGTFRDATWKLVTLNVNLSGYSTTTLPTRTGCINANTPTAGWYYYPSWSGTIQRAGQTPLSITATSPVQIGMGANTQDLGLLGLYGKFSLNGGQTGVFACQLINSVACGTTTNAATAAVFAAEGKGILNSIRLSWTENQAEVGEVFAIEKLKNGQFETIENRKAEVGTGNRFYTAYDNEPNEGENMYRINLLKNDGSQRQSADITVLFSKTVYATVFPNPTDSYFSVLLNDVPETETIFRLYNAFGHQIIERKAAVNTKEAIQLDVNDLPNGVYQLRISQNGKRDFTKPVVVLK